MNLQQIWNATFLRRWHRNQHLADTHDTLAGHQGRVALLLLSYWPDSSAAALHYALTHDLPESGVGDMPGDVKRNYPNLATEIAKAEAIEAGRLGITWNITEREKARADFCDKLDAWLWMQHHKPELDLTPDWRDARERLQFMADNLGVELPL